MCKAWKSQQLVLERAGAVGDCRKVLEQMPEAKTPRRELEHVTVHQVNHCVLGP